MELSLQGTSTGFVETSCAKLSTFWAPHNIPKKDEKILLWSGGGVGLQILGIYGPHSTRAVESKKIDISRREKNDFFFGVYSFVRIKLAQPMLCRYPDKNRALGWKKNYPDKNFYTKNIP